MSQRDPNVEYVDLSTYAKDTGFKATVLISGEVFHDYIVAGEDEALRTERVRCVLKGLYGLIIAMRGLSGEDRFAVSLQYDNSKVRQVSLVPTVIEEGGIHTILINIDKAMHNGKS